MASSFSVPCPKTCALLSPNLNNPNKYSLRNTSVAVFHSDLKPNFSLVSQSSSALQVLQATKRNQNGVVKVSAKLDEIAHGKSSNSAAPKDNSEESSKLSSKDIVPDIASMTAFMNQVAGLVELVDSRDIMELQLKQNDCEVLIRKKEALPPPPAPPMMMHSSQPQALFHSQPPPPQAAAAAPPSAAASASSPTLPATAKPKSSHPPLKCPMAGTFYRAPAPGAPPFVKVGDKVRKGQVICIIEAMKLMNEIEADQSGTIVDIIAEDGKPVSLDTPLLVIEP